VIIPVVVVLAAVVVVLVAAVVVVVVTVQVLLCSFTEIRLHLEWLPKQCKGMFSKSRWSFFTAPTLFDSWLRIIMAQRADLVRHFLVASVNLPLPL